MLKPRGQWLTSLFANGELPSWHAFIENSAAGPVVVLGKDENAPQHLQGGIRVSEKESALIFDQNLSHDFGIQLPLPPQLVIEVFDMAKDSMEPYCGIKLFSGLQPSPQSVFRFSIEAELTESWKDPTGTKVFIDRSHCNGGVDTKEYVGEPVKFLEEMENARKSMMELREMVLTSQESVVNYQEMLQSVLDGVVAEYELES